MENQKLLEVVTEYAVENKVEVFQDIDINDQGLSLNIDQGFLEFFEKSYPAVNLDEKLEEFFSVLIKSYMQEMENGESANDTPKG